jgi:AraC-like DNA-binding protein
VDLMLVRISRTAARNALTSLLQHQIYAPLTFRISNQPPSHEKVHLLERFLDFLYEEADCSSPSLLFSPASLEQAEQLLATLVLETLPHSYSSEVQALGSPEVPWHLRAADEVIQERLSEMTSTSKLAAAVGVSPRMLRRAFVQAKGVTPTRYLRDLRFQRVREELRQAGPPETVTVIALKWGFSHLGRFAVEYRQMFSERPSQTLRAS